MSFTDEVRIAMANIVHDEWVKKENVVEYVLENHYDEVREAVFEQEAESRRE